MSYIYPYKSNEEFKKVVSFTDISFDRDNIQSSMKLAADHVKDLIGKTVWDHIMAYFNADEPDTVMDEAVELMAGIHSPLTLYHHFIWLQLRISSNSITVTKSEGETAAYKYQTDEAKEKLLEVAWTQLGAMIDFLDANSDPENGKIKPWRSTEQYTDRQKLIIPSYKEYCKLAGLERNAAFYMRNLTNIYDLQLDHVESRVNWASDSTFMATFAALSDKKKRYLKKALAFLSMAEAVEDFDLLILPPNIRQNLENDKNKKSAGSDMQYIREKLAGKIRNKGTDFLRRFDYLVSSEDTVSADPYDKYESDLDADDKFVSMI